MPTRSAVPRSRGPCLLKSITSLVFLCWFAFLFPQSDGFFSCFLLTYLLPNCSKYVKLPRNKGLKCRTGICQKKHAKRIAGRQFSCGKGEGDRVTRMNTDSWSDYYSPQLTRLHQQNNTSDPQERSNFKYQCLNIESEGYFISVTISYRCFISLSSLSLIRFGSRRLALVALRCITFPFFSSPCFPLCHSPSMMFTLIVFLASERSRVIYAMYRFC